MTNTRHTPGKLTAKEAATLRRLDRKITGGKNVTRAEIERAIDLKRKKGGATALLRKGCAA